MTTKLEGQLKRELAIDGEPYTLILSPVGFVLALKGRRKGLEIHWAELISGDAALATALNASLVAPTLRKPSGERSKQRERREGTKSPRNSK